MPHTLSETLFPKADRWRVVIAVYSMAGAGALWGWLHPKGAHSLLWALIDVAYFGGIILWVGYGHWMRSRSIRKALAMSSVVSLVMVPLLGLHWGWVRTSMVYFGMLVMMALSAVMWYVEGRTQSQPPPVSS